MTALRIVFMGTAELSCAGLRMLAREPQFHIAAVVTQCDKPRGRHLKAQPSPVKSLSLELNLPLLQPPRARDEKFVGALRALMPDLIVVAAYGQILPPAILALPRHGCVNVHTSLLPKYRGAAPIQWAIANGDTETGVTIMKMDEGLDTGPVLSVRRVPILATDDAETLHDRLAQLGAELLAQTLPDFVAGKIQPRPQPAEGVSHAPKIKKEDGRIDWTWPAKTIGNRLRAFTPWPGAFSFWPGAAKPQLWKIWKAQVVEGAGEPGEIRSADKSGIVVSCGENALRILELQREGGKRLTADQFLAGHPIQPGEKFTR